MTRLLFLCSRNRLRSPTAQDLFAEYEGVETDSAGLSPDADCPVDAGQIDWADHILVMEKAHLTRLNKKFSSLLKGKKVSVLHILDNYEYMDDALIALLKKKCAPVEPRLR